MVGLIRVLIVTPFLAASVLAQTPASPNNTSSDSAEAAKRQGGKPPVNRKLGGPGSPEFRDVRKAMEALTPEQRQRFVDNFKRWANLPPEERTALAEREGLRRKKMEEEIDRAINDAGLQLDADRRLKFARRYIEQRRKLEEQLRSEMEAKRQPLLQELVEKLKAEFATPTAP